MAKSSAIPTGEAEFPAPGSADVPVTDLQADADGQPAEQQSQAAAGWLGGLRNLFGLPTARRRGGDPAEVAGEVGVAAVTDAAPPDPTGPDHAGPDLAGPDQADPDAVEVERAGGVAAGGPTEAERADLDPAAVEPEVAAAQPVSGEAGVADPALPGDADQEPSEPDSVVRLRLGLPGLSPQNAGPGAAAFFDVDNTTIRGSSFVALAKGMADRDYFTTAEIMGITWKQLKFVVSGRENMDDITAATENGLEFVKGREVTEIQTLSDEVYDEKMVKRLWAGTLALTQAHISAGHQVWLVSATPREVAEVIAARLGLTGGLGTVAEVRDGRYTGRLSGLPLHGQVKADVVAELAATHGLDLARCSAYSDSANDIPMLSVVGFPVAINPDGRLRAHARANGWPIRDYRIRGKESVRKGVPAAASAGLIAGVAVGVAKGIATLRGRAGA